MASVMPLSLHSRPNGTWSASSCATSPGLGYDSGRSATDSDDTSPSSPSSTPSPYGTPAPMTGEALLLAHMATSAPAPRPWSSSTASTSTMEDVPAHPAGCEPDAIKLFVGNIPKSCTEQQLLPLFQSAGRVVELAIMRERELQSSKGSAFLWYATRAEADAAIQQFHLRYILNDPVGDNTRRLVLRKAWAPGDATSAHAHAHAGPCIGDGAASGAAQMLYLSMGPKTTPAPAPAKPAMSPISQLPSAQAKPQPLPVPQFAGLGYPPQGPLPAGLWQQPAPGPEAWAGPARPGSEQLYPPAMPPGLAMHDLLAQLTPAAGLAARRGGAAAPAPVRTAYPASLHSLTTTRAPQLATAAGPGYADCARQAAPTAAAAAAAYSCALSHAQREPTMDPTHSGAGFHGPPYPREAVFVPRGQEAAPGLGLVKGQGLPAFAADSEPPAVALSKLLDVAQLQQLLDYLHTVQGMSGCELALSLSQLPGCFQLRVSGGVAQVQAGEMLINSLLMGGAAPPPSLNWTL